MVEEDSCDVVLKRKDTGIEFYEFITLFMVMNADIDWYHGDTVTCDVQLDKYYKAIIKMSVVRQWVE